MDQIKEAFQKIKKDIENLDNEMFSIKKEIFETREGLIGICNVIKEMSDNLKELNTKVEVFSQRENPANQQIIQTTPTHNPTDNSHFKALKDQNMPISIGNEGVPTDRQTDQQTDKYKENKLKTPQNLIDNAAEMLDSLDSIKKEIRLKFKRLTDQEVLIFSTLYQLEEEQGYADYKSLSYRLKLTESSIRDYIGRLVKKGIPVDKKRINNKTIHLFISPNLRKIATLTTILKLRDI